jgi:hypothetical protein
MCFLAFTAGFLLLFPGLACSYSEGKANMLAAC